MAKPQLIIPISFTDPTIIKVCSQSQKWIRKKGFECVAPVSYRNRQKQLKVSELVTIGEFNIYLNENCAGVLHLDTAKVPESSAHSGRFSLAHCVFSAVKCGSCLASAPHWLTVLTICSHSLPILLLSLDTADWEQTTCVAFPSWRTRTVSAERAAAWGRALARLARCKSSLWSEKRLFELLTILCV